MSDLKRWPLLAIAAVMLLGMAVFAALLFIGSPTPLGGEEQALEPDPPEPMVPRLPDDWHAGGPYTGRITCLHSDGKYLYAGGWHMGVYRMDDARLWRPHGDGMGGFRDVLAIGGDGDRLYAGTFHGELFVLRGGIWTLLRDFGEGENAAVRSIRVRGDELLVSTDGGLYYSSDGGENLQPAWTRVGVSDAIFSDLPRRAVVFATGGLGVGACEDLVGRCGPLARYTGGVLVTRLAQATGKRRTIYVLAEGDGVYASDDGRSYDKLDLGMTYSHPEAMFADDQGVVIALRGIGLLEKHGTTGWHPIPFRRAITDVVRHGGSVYVGTDGPGVLRVVGDRFEQCNNGLLNFPIEIVDDALHSKAGDAR